MENPIMLEEKSLYKSLIKQKYIKLNLKMKKNTRTTQQQTH